MTGLERLQKWVKNNPTRNSFWVKPVRDGFIGMVQVNGNDMGDPFHSKSETAHELYEELAEEFNIQPIFLT